MFPALASQQEAAQVAALAAWVNHETELLALLTDAGLTPAEARYAMNAEGIC